MNERHVKRLALFGKLTSTQAMESQLMLVCAPAGYGKSTFAVEWLQSLKLANAWLTLDEGDNDISRFLAYFLAAIRMTGVTIGKDIEHLASEVGIKTVTTVMTLLINAIVESSDRKIIVLDDFHVIRSAEINEAVRFFIDHQPANLSIILISREDPLLPLARLRAKGRITEIRAQELQLSEDEAKAFFSQSLGQPIKPEVIRKINSKAEGWVAGLQLAGLLLKGCSGQAIEAFADKFDGTNSYIIDYLVEEVLQKQTPEIRHFLYKTSVLDQMTAELCNELTGSGNGKEMLQQLEKQNLFIIPLDSNREWHRYHPLFSDSLKAGLSASDEKQLCGRAAAWMLEKKAYHEAVQYAFRSEDMFLALKMVEASIIEVFQTAQIETALQWMSKLPFDLVKNSEVLSVRKAILLHIAGKPDEALLHLEALGDDFYRQASSHNRGLMAIVKAFVALQRGEDAEKDAQEAYERIEAWDPIARTSAINTLARVQFNKGKTLEAMHTWQQAYQAGIKMGYTFVTTLALQNYGACLELLGKRLEALNLYEGYIQGMLDTIGKPLPYSGLIYVSAASLYYEGNELEKAKLYIEKGSELLQSLAYPWVQPVIAKARILLASEQASEAITEPKRERQIISFNERLSHREMDIVRLLAEGLSNAEIAKALFISTNTAQWHISHIYRKLGVKSRTQAILKAKEYGLV